MTEQEKQDILDKAKSFFSDVIVNNHKKNTKRLRLRDFNINPFLVKYLANFLTGSSEPQDIAKALIYPRVLGTSITTSFGTNLQKFCTTTLEGYSSTTSGIDIEFIDAIDGRRKYCQIKAGPNTINRDDITTIINHFGGVRRLAKTNGLRLEVDDLIVGVFYGTRDQLSAHYKEIHESYPVFVGQEFWHRLTGDENFYFDLIDSIAESALEEDCTELLAEAIESLSIEIENDDSLFSTDN